MTSALRSFVLVIGIVVASAPGCADAQSGAVGIRKPAPALEKPADALSVLVIGDWGRHGEHNQRLVASAMDRAATALDAELVISTGDNFYPNGIQSTGDPNIRASFEDVYRQHALQVDWLVALGNHDYRGNAQAQVDYTAKSRRWRMPSRYFAVKKAIDDSTSVEFFILDTSPFQRDYYAEPEKYAGIAQDTAKQRRWLDSALTASKAQWKIVVGHHHVYSGGKRDTNADLERWLVPILERQKVAAYVCGHEHVLTHIRRPGGTVDYFISGAGSEVRAPGNAAGTRYAEGRAGFMTLSFTPRMMVTQAIDKDGVVRYVSRRTR